MSKLSKSVLDKIKKEEMKPKPKWWFVVMHVLMWSAIVISVLIGSLAMGVVLHEIFGTEWRVVERLGYGWVPGALFFLPYLWFGALGLTLLVAFYLYRHTEEGYKHQPWAVAGATALISVLLGTGLYFSHVPGKFKAVMVEHVPPFAELEIRRQEMFVAPERGVLVGVITDVQGDALIIVNDVRRKAWSVDIAEARYGNDLIEVDNEVVCLGEQNGESGFVAHEIFPFREPVLKHLQGFRKKYERNVRPGL